MFTGKNMGQQERNVRARVGFIHLLKCACTQLRRVQLAQIQVGRNHVSGYRVETLVFDLPHFHGPGEVLHLRSLLNPLSPELVVAYPPLMPAALVELLDARGIGVVVVPDEEFETMGPNVLGLPGGRALALAGNHVTRQRLEATGIEVAEYNGDEISRLGDGGPTCLTLPVDFGVSGSS